MSMIKEFQEFALKGNVVDLAVGVVIGAAFGKIVASMVENIISPIVGFLTGGVNLNELAIDIGTKAKPLLLKYGVLLQTLFDFAIIAFVLFMVIKAMNSAKKRFAKEAVAAPPAPPAASEIYLREIRDALVKR